MRRIPNFLVMLVMLLAFGPLALRADPPDYAGTAFDKMQTTTDDAALFFGVVVALAVLVTGFFLGRKWLRSVG